MEFLFSIYTFNIILPIVLFIMRGVVCYEPSRTGQIDNKNILAGLVKLLCKFPNWLMKK
jgi:hypothetical protein